MTFQIPNRLEQSIKRNELIIFVGAGLSKNHGLPTWNKIIEDLLEDPETDIKNANILLQNLESRLMSPLEILEKIKNDKSIILEHFENCLNIDNLVSDIHKELSSITKMFITTNFDKLIEFNTGIKTIITHDSNYNLQKIGKKKEFVIKLHGDIENLDKCVIFNEQYENLYNTEQLAPFKLKSLLSDYTFLFLGFSFNDPYVDELFKYMSKLLNGMGPRHYIVSDTDKEIENLQTINIKEFKNLMPFLKELTIIKNNKELENVKNGLENIDVDITEEDFLFEEDGSDIAPNVSNWVGREKELATLNNSYFKVIFITGIGGEGKSALASHYSSETNKFEFVDWRDFKEEDHKFQTKIISMILKVAPEKIKQKSLIGLSNEKLIIYFFKILNNKKALFILDNVDSYIDFEKREPIGSIGKLFNAALKYEHNSQFIFTCRPFIMYSGVDFYHLKLTGLTEEATVQLFNKGNTIIKRDVIPKLAKRAFTLTKGHALWLSFILAQSRKGEDSLVKFLDSIESGDKSINISDSAYLSRKLLDNIWGMLGDNEKTLLRVLAEAIYSESIKNYSNLLARTMNYKKFTKALNTLISLNFIIQKRNTEFIELHPLVKEFIKSNYLLSDRKKYISLFIQYYDSFVVLLKNNLSYKNKYEDFTNFTKKAELSINAGEYQKTIDTLNIIHLSITSAGYVEEFLRVSKLLFNSIKWENNPLEEYSNFEDLYRNVIKNFAEFGEFDYSIKMINTLQSTIESKTEKYILLCEVRSYVYWIHNKLDDAISTCEEALYLIKRAEQHDKYNINHSYSLALRDTKDIEKVDKALEYFLLTNILDDLIKKDYFSKDINAATYGNVGKCLFYKEDFDNSLTCCYKSFYSHYSFSNSQRLLNLGYAAFWIAEIFIELKENNKSYYFLRYAKDCWKNVSPILYNKNIDIFNLLNENEESKAILEKDEWRIEKFCIELIEDSLNIKFKAKN